MAFKLKSIRDDQSQIFSIQKILEVLGEKVNDEIFIDGKAYRISSFEDLSGGGDGGAVSTWQIQRFVITENTQNQFPFPDRFNDTESLFLVLNQALYSYGKDKDYHIENNSLYWHGDFELEVSDHLYLKYLKSL